MPDAINILLTTIFVNNFVMVQFLGLCPFMGASNRLDSALGIAAATLFVMTLASSLSYLLNAWFQVPLEIEFLRINLFIVVIAAVVQFAEIVMRAMEAGLGFGLVLILFAAMREHLEAADVPKPFKGTPIHMITAGLLSLAFMGFTGMS